MRFIAVIKDSGRIYTDYQVIDLDRRIVMCVCSDSQDADTIATVLNIQHRERMQLALNEINSPQQS